MQPQQSLFWTPLSGLMFGWIGVGITVALGIAFSGLEDVAQLPWFVDIMMTVVQSIEPWSRASPNPQHTAIFFATMWLLLPVPLYLIVKDRDLYFPLAQWRPDRATKTTLVWLLVATVFVAFGVFGLGSDSYLFSGSDSRRSLRRMVLGSRLNAGLFGSAVVFFTGYVVIAAGVFLHRTINRRQ